MTVSGVRAFLFSVLPLLLSAGILLLDRSASTRERRLEVPLILLFGLIVTAVVATAFAVGFAAGQPLLVSTLGTIAASAVTTIILARSPAHKPPGKTPLTKAA